MVQESIRNETVKYVILDEKKESLGTETCADYKGKLIKCRGKDPTFKKK